MVVIVTDPLNKRKLLKCGYAIIYSDWSVVMGGEHSGCVIIYSEWSVVMDGWSCGRLGVEIGWEG